MKTITLTLASFVLVLSATTALAMNGKADDINEARSYPDKTADAVADVRISAK